MAECNIARCFWDEQTIDNAVRTEQNQKKALGPYGSGNEETIMSDTPAGGCPRRQKSDFISTGQTSMRTKIKFPKMLLCVMAAWLSAAGLSEEPVKADDETFKRDRYLVLDSRIIESTDNAELTVGVAQKDKNNPLFGEDKPWEARFDNLYPNVLYDPQDKLYKCWYNPFSFFLAHTQTPRSKRASVDLRKVEVAIKGKRRELALCYAFSRDGIHWEKPELGIVEHEGNRKNNLVLRSSVGPGVILDTLERDPQKRFKMFGRTDIHRTSPFAVSFSPDGIHWGRQHLCPGIDPGPVDGTHYNALWVPELGEYAGFTRLRGKRDVRKVGRTTSKDFLNWTRAKPVFEGSNPNLQIYSMPVFRYADLYLGLPVMYDAVSDRAFTGLAWSPNTINWYFIAEGTPLIANGKKMGDYDWGCVYSSAYPIFLDKEIRLYYGASDGRHFGWRDGFLCLATLRPDGFAGYEQISGVNRKYHHPATITTKPVLAGAGSLRLSADMVMSGYVKVTILDNKNKELAQGELITKTGTDVEVQWKEGFSFDSLKGNDIRLRFELRDAKLYSFSFK